MKFCSIDAKDRCQAEVIMGCDECRFFVEDKPYDIQVDDIDGWE